jgi:flagellar basal-body rod modification protein FlgD
VGIIPISSVTNPTPKTTAKLPKNTLDDNSFMNLLVAQLTNQNPLQPSDPNSFLQQTATMTMVQKLEQMATDSTANTQAQQSLTATTMVGKQVTWNDADGHPLSGVVSSAKLGSAGATLVVGTGNSATNVPLNQVVSVSNPPAPPAAAAVPPAATTPKLSTPQLTAASLWIGDPSTSASDGSTGSTDLLGAAAAPVTPDSTPLLASSASYQLDPTAFALAGLSSLAGSNS